MHREVRYSSRAQIKARQLDDGNWRAGQNSRVAVAGELQRRKLQAEWRQTRRLVGDGETAERRAGRNDDEEAS